MSSTRISYQALPQSLPVAPERPAEVEIDMALLGQFVQQGTHTIPVPPKVDESRAYALIGQMLINDRKSLTAWAGTHPDIRRALRSDRVCEKVLAGVRWDTHVAPSIAVVRELQKEKVPLNVLATAATVTAAVWIMAIVLYAKKTFDWCDEPGGLNSPTSCKVGMVAANVFLPLVPGILALLAAATGAVAASPLVGYEVLVEPGRDTRQDRRSVAALVRHDPRPEHLETAQRRAAFQLAQRLGDPALRSNAPASFPGAMRWLAGTMTCWLGQQNTNTARKLANDRASAAAINWLDTHIAPEDKAELVRLYGLLGDEARKDAAGTMRRLQTALTPEQNRAVFDAIKSIGDFETRRTAVRRFAALPASMTGNPQAGVVAPAQIAHFP